MAIRLLNQNAEELNKSAAVNMNVNAAKGLQDVLKTNLGPKGTIKMLVGADGDIKLTKDGKTLLKEMILVKMDPSIDFSQGKKRKQMATPSASTSTSTTSKKRPYKVDFSSTS